MTDNKNTANKITAIFKALSDETRLRLLALLLSTDKELCVCELVDSLLIASYTASRNLKELKNAGLIEESRNGKFIMYRVIYEQPEYILKLFDSIHAIPKHLFELDRQKLAERLDLRQCGRCVVGMN